MTRVCICPRAPCWCPLLRYDLPRHEALRALQFIRPDGAKIYQRGMDKPGCCLRLGDISVTHTLCCWWWRGMPRA